MMANPANYPANKGECQANKAEVSLWDIGIPGLSKTKNLNCCESEMIEVYGALDIRESPRSFKPIRGSKSSKPEMVQVEERRETSQASPKDFQSQTVHRARVSTKQQVIGLNGVVPRRKAKTIKPKLSDFGIVVPTSEETNRLMEWLKRRSDSGEEQSMRIDQSISGEESNKSNRFMEHMKELKEGLARLTKVNPTFLENEDGNPRRSNDNPLDKAYIDPIGQEDYKRGCSDPSDRRNGKKAQTRQDCASIHQENQVGLQQWYGTLKQSMGKTIEQSPNGEQIPKGMNEKLAQNQTKHESVEQQNMGFGVSKSTLKTKFLT